MFNIAIMVLRYIFLALLLVFIFRLVKWMVGDLHQTGRSFSGLYRQAGQLRDGYSINEGALLTVMESVSPDLPAGTSLPLGQQKLFGRAETNDIQIRDSFTSNRHARIFLKEGHYWLEDLQSTNGTFLNEVQVDQPTVLADGDIIKIGGTIFQFVRWGV